VNKLQRDACFWPETHDYMYGCFHPVILQISDDIQKVAFGVGGKAGMVLNEINHKVFQRK
jgi:hypothetical protein